MKLTGLTSAVIAFGLSYSTVALAQEQVWLKDRRYSEGIGIRTGDLELHPGLGAEFGYDSNYFLRADSEDPIPALRLRIVPSFSLSKLSHAYNPINTRGRGRFLPRPACFYDAPARLIPCNNNPAPGQLPSDPILVRIGLNGLVTPAFSLLAMVGWGASFYQGAFAQQF